MKRHTPGSLAAHFALLIAVLVILIPLAVVVLGSLKTVGEAGRFGLALPSVWMPGNYAEVFKKSPLGRSFLNSVFLTSGALLLCLGLGAPASFVIARRSGRMIRSSFYFLLIGIVAPMSIIPTIALVKAVGVYGSRLSVILLYAASYLPWSVFFMTGFIKSVPRDFDEAAVIDGASASLLFGKIIFPLLTPVIATNLVFVAMSIWNDFMIPLYFLSSASNWTMPLMVYNFFGQYQRQWNYVFACLILTAAPITALYLASQRFIISGMTNGGLKS